jgi:hypothetical protein
MLLRKPSLTVTGEPAAAAVEVAVEPDDEDVDEEEDEEQPAASNRAAPTIAALVTRRI